MYEFVEFPCTLDMFESKMELELELKEWLTYRASSACFIRIYNNTEAFFIIGTHGYRAKLKKISAKSKNRDTLNVINHRT